MPPLYARPKPAGFDTLVDQYQQARQLFEADKQNTALPTIRAHWNRLFDIYERFYAMTEDRSIESDLNVVHMWYEENKSKYLTGALVPYMNNRGAKKLAAVARLVELLDSYLQHIQISEVFEGGEWMASLFAD